MRSGQQNTSQKTDGSAGDRHGNENSEDDSNNQRENEPSSGDGGSRSIVSLPEFVVPLYPLLEREPAQAQQIGQSSSLRAEEIVAILDSAIEVASGLRADTINDQRESTRVHKPDQGEGERRQ